MRFLPIGWIDQMDCDARQSAGCIYLPVEAQFLLLCARRELDPDAVLIAQRHLTRQDFNWDCFVRLIAQHGIAPYIRARFDANPSWIAPQEFRAEINKRCKAIAFRNLQFVGELVRLDEILSNSGVKAIWFKGPILASQAYQNLTMRQFCDLDVLIPHDRVGDVSQILQRQGYTPCFDVVTPQKQRLHEKVSNALAFDDRKRGINIDVHWSIADDNYSFSNKASMATTQLELAGRRVTTFAAESMLCYLCYHGCKHGWGAFRSILDVAEFVRSNPGLAWDTLTTAAQLPIGTPRMLKLGFALAQLGAGTRLPHAVIEWIESDSQTATLAAKVLERHLVSPTSFDTRIYLATMDSWADRIRHVMSIGWKPSVFEIERITIPEKLFFFYRGLRFIRLFQKHILKRGRHGL